MGAPAAAKLTAGKDDEREDSSGEGDDRAGAQAEVHAGDERLARGIGETNAADATEVLSDVAVPWTVMRSSLLTPSW